MVVELGLFALILALMLSCAQAFFGLAGAHYGNRRWMAAARPAVRGSVRLRRACRSPCWRRRSTRTTSRCCTSPTTRTRRCRRSTASPRCGARTKARCCCGRCRCRPGRSRSASSASTCRDSFAARVIGVLGIVSVGFQAVHAVHVQPFRAPDSRPRPTARTSIRCCRTSRLPCIRRCSTWATSASRSPSLSRWRRCSKASSTRSGRAGHGPGRRSPGCS